jgi:hypothetical protein
MVHALSLITECSTHLQQTKPPATTAATAATMEDDQDVKKSSIDGKQYLDYF